MNTVDISAKIFIDLEKKINQLMEETGADLATTCTVMNKITKNLMGQISERYP